MIRRLAVAAALSVCLLGWMAPLAAQSTETPLTPRTFIDIARKTLPAVVSIEVEVPPSQAMLDREGASSSGELLRRFFQNPQGSGELNDFLERFGPEDFGSSGAGSGVVIEQKDGWAYALTNAHVLDDNPRAIVRVTLDASFEYEGPTISSERQDVEVIGRDELTDLALFRFRIPEGIRVPTVRFADSDELEVGEWVLALGNPLELNNSVSQGIISAKHRNIGKSAIEDLVQTTAAINPGNSGGPLVNLDGQIVGINNAIATRSGRWEGVGFAIPSNQARRVSRMFIDQGKVSRGYLGISMSDLTEEYAEAFDIASTAGVVVDSIHPNSPAQSAGLEVGDVIVSVGERRVRTTQDILQAVGNRMSGEAVTVKVLREKPLSPAERAVEITLAERPSQDVLMKMNDRPIMLTRDALALPRVLGFEGDPANEGDKRGILVTEVTPESNADQAGLRPDDLIVEVNTVPTPTRRALLTGLLSNEEGDPFLIKYERDGKPAFLSIAPPDDEDRKRASTKN